MVDKQPDERVGSDGETYFDPEKYQEQFEHDELEPVVLIPSDENLVGTCLAPVDFVTVS